MNIPEFLKRENASAPKPEVEKMMALIDEYENRIGGALITDTSHSTEEWIDMLQECLDKKITIWELWGEEFDPDADY